MKNRFILALLCLTISFAASAQAIEITPSYGYQFGTRIDYVFSSVRAEPSGQWGIAGGIEFRPGYVAKLSYVSMGTEFTGRDVDFTNNRNVRISDLQTDWFLLGIQKYLKDGKVKPFVGSGLGIAVVTPKNINRNEFPNLNLSSNTYFAFNFEAGVNIMFTDAIGLNLQGNLYFPVNYGGFYVGTGGAGVTTGSTQIVGGFSGGLVFRIDTD
ncbi:outer membrane beta-barrel protein [Winogradskyella aurantia]|uniref:Outer membrane protein beta-barrel domain-containing protein n=1 Tax=Winogradskyella aurantia TaxID=1915063 RepID=A0A265UXD4_9FLAO|nr:outer membrane beta-barrel protein [Winogradskyella aurantia]OZV69956.1 hypothetical protein CA834_04880 [Winogradskyella aurantia]